MKTNWPTYLSVVVESVLLGDLLGSIRSAGHVNGELIRIDWHWSLPWSRFRSRAGQQHAHNQQRHPEDHVVDDEWRRRVLQLSRTIFPALIEPRDVATDVRRHVSRVRRTSRFNFTIERGRLLLANRSRFSTKLASLTSDTRTLLSRERCSGSGTTNVDRRWRMKTRRRCAASFARRRRRCQRGWSYPATQRRGKPQVIASVHSRHARKVGRTRWEFLRTPSVVWY